MPQPDDAGEGFSGLQLEVLAPKGDLHRQLHGGLLCHERSSDPPRDERPGDGGHSAGEVPSTRGVGEPPKSLAAQHERVHRRSCGAQCALRRKQLGIIPGLCSSHSTTAKRLWHRVKAVLRGRDVAGPGVKVCGDVIVVDHFAPEGVRRGLSQLEPRERHCPLRKGGPNVTVPHSRILAALRHPHPDHDPEGLHLTGEADRFDLLDRVKAAPRWEPVHAFAAGAIYAPELGQQIPSARFVGTELARLIGVIRQRDPVQLRQMRAEEQLLELWLYDQQTLPGQREADRRAPSLLKRPLHLILVRNLFCLGPALGGRRLFYHGRPIRLRLTRVWAARRGSVVAA